MRNKSQDKNLRQSVAEIYEYAVTYCKMLEKDATSSQDRIFAVMAEKEFTIGRDMLDLLIAAKGEAFVNPEAATTVMQSLLNFRAGLDEQQFPLITWRVMNAANQCRMVLENCLNWVEPEPSPKSVLH